ncbi:MAG: hypothetical protein WBD31_00365 [Rubripirellula sp.]
MPANSSKRSDLPSNQIGWDALDAERAIRLNEMLIETLGRHYPRKMKARGEGIKDLRKRIGYELGRTQEVSQEEFLGIVDLNITQATLSRYENKPVDVPTIHLAAMTDSVAGVSLDWIAVVPNLESLRAAELRMQHRRLRSDVCAFLRRGMLDGTLPDDNTVDLRHFVLHELKDERFRRYVSFTLDDLDLAWRMLEIDRLVEIDKDGAVYRRFTFDEMIRTFCVFERLVTLRCQLMYELVQAQLACKSKIKRPMTRVAEELMKAGFIRTTSHSDFRLEGGIKAYNERSSLFDSIIASHDGFNESLVTLHFQQLERATMFMSCIAQEFIEVSKESVTSESLYRQIFEPWCECIRRQQIICLEVIQRGTTMVGHVAPEKFAYAYSAVLGTFQEEMSVEARRVQDWFHATTSMLNVFDLSVEKLEGKVSRCHYQSDEQVG